MHEDDNSTDNRQSYNRNTTDTTLSHHPPLSTPNTPTTAAIHPQASYTPPTGSIASSSTTSTTHSSPTTNITNTTNRKRRRTEPPIYTNANTTQEQLYLDFGQASFGTRTVCPICNSLYVHGIEEDEAYHRRVCNEYAFGVVLAWSTKSTTTSNSAWKNLRIVQRGCRTQRDVEPGVAKAKVVVVEVRPEDPVPYRKKVLQVKGIVDREVGFVPPSRAGLGEESRAGETVSLGGKTAFFYVEDKRIVGFCMVEVISKAYVLLNAPQEEDDDGSNGSIHAPAPTLNTHPHTVTTPLTPTESKHTPQKHYYRSTRPSKAMMGVHQIWCHRRHRCKGIATTLVDAARDKLVYGMTIPFDLVAFSSPTVDGAAFARRYSETERPLVYDCR